MKSIWDHFAIILYAGLIILVCLLIAYAGPSEKKDPAIDFLPQPTETAAPVRKTAAPEVIPEETVIHAPEQTILHRYDFSSPKLELVPKEDGMLTERDLAGSRYYFEPSGKEFHVYHEENGLYDCFIYGTGPVGELDAYAEYIFRYDASSKKAVSFVQEQHIDTGNGMNRDQLSIYAANAGYLLDSVFSGTQTDISRDRRKIGELALYFFTSYIPGHPSVPAVIHFRMPAYVLTFVMDTDIFITMISPGSLPVEYTVENAAD